MLCATVFNVSLFLLSGCSFDSHTDKDLDLLVNEPKEEHVVIQRMDKSLQRINQSNKESSVLKLNRFTVLGNKAHPDSLFIAVIKDNETSIEYMVVDNGSGITVTPLLS